MNTNGSIAVCVLGALILIAGILLLSHSRKNEYGDDYLFFPIGSGAFILVVGILSFWIHFPG
jgi:hypothetical protein